MPQKLFFFKKILIISQQTDRGTFLLTAVPRSPAPSPFDIALQMKKEEEEEEEKRPLLASPLLRSPERSRRPSPRKREAEGEEDEENGAASAASAQAKRRRRSQEGDE